MPFKKSHLLSFIFGAFIVAIGFVTILLALFLYFPIKWESHYLPSIILAYLLSTLLVFGILLLWNKFLFQQNIKDLYQKLPNLNLHGNYAKNMQELYQQIAIYSQAQSQEILDLNERENYRREFLGNISHELKTPLFSIQGFILTLIEGGVEDINIRDKYLNRINKSVERLIYIVKDLDMISELEKGHLILDRKPFNIHALTQEVFDLLETRADKNNIKLQFDKNYTQSVKVLGDIERIEQVLINLITNAIRHSGREATVTVSFAQENDKIKIKIEDTGIGMKAAHLERIFERFYRIEKSRTRNKGGSGLGLAIVKHILEAHGEKITVESIYSKGTTFTFYLSKA